jgi:Zn-dependent protease with chaperone function
VLKSQNSSEMHKIYTTLVFVISLISFSNAQVSSTYQPLSDKPENLPALNQALDDKLQKDLTGINRKSQKTIVDIYSERTKYVKDKLTDGYFLFDEKLNTYFNNILKTIQTNNTDIPSPEIRIFVSRSTEPNALSIGEGTLVINTGLINELENESQLAFVLAHELAHYVLNHSSEAIKTQVSLLENEEIASRLKKASKQKYNSASKTLDVLQNIVYQNHKLSRTAEISADSLALIYLLRTDYDAQQAIKVLNILDTVYQRKYADSLDLKMVFNLPSQPFKADWLKREESSLSFSNQKTEDAWSPDSLKTHPDCPERIKLLEGYLQNYRIDNKVKYLQGEETFQNLVKISAYEELESALFFKDYGRCLYFATTMLQKNPEDVYVNLTLGKCFQSIHEARVNHELGKYAELPAEYHPSGYRQILTFIQNLRLKEISTLSEYFSKKAAH